jgi:argininosuccinate lyase
MIARGPNEFAVRLHPYAALTALSDEEFRTASNVFGEDVRETFDVRKALGRRTTTGSPSLENIERQIARWRELLL